MKKELKTIFISLNWVFTASENAQKQDEVKFIKKLSQDFDIKLIVEKDEVIAAKWLIDNNVSCLIKYLVSDAQYCSLYLNDDCIMNCKDFDKLYNTIIAFKQP